MVFFIGHVIHCDVVVVVVVAEDVVVVVVVVVVDTDSRHSHF